MKRLAGVLLWLGSAVSFAAPRAPVYVVLWFDTEDYIEPAADDAALRLASDLTAQGVRATFKVVGEKARTLERRGRWDVVRALALHDIGYHSDNHSIPPTPAVYLSDLGFLEGAEEFERREGAGVADVRRVLGAAPSCYGQPGSSWGPQCYPALRRMGIPVYLDEGSQVGLDEQPFWYGGLLHVFNLGRFVLRASLEPGARPEADFAAFDKASAELARRGGGLLSVYYHPTEFVTTEFWDAVNFSHGLWRAPGEWRRPHLRARADAERCYAVLRAYVEHARSVPGVRFVTARELLQLYASPAAPPVDRAPMAAHLAARQTFLRTEASALSGADMLLALLGLEPRFVDGPASRVATAAASSTLSRAAFEGARQDAVSFIRAHGRLPGSVWAGGDRLSLGDFAATLAADDGRSPTVTLRRENLEFEKYFSTDPKGSFDWVIHPEGFDGGKLLELGRLQGWTLKPALLR